MRKIKPIVGLEVKYTIIAFRNACFLNSNPSWKQKNTWNKIFQTNFIFSLLIFLDIFEQSTKLGKMNFI